ncbi:hypothetical protein [Streptomyces sp. CA-111067]|uniref:hypothetical protein n=1 Tax=Streptomyces sp. CA-111067 TaxID=3240046 RepID=UPI003D97D1A5
MKRRIGIAMAASACALGTAFAFAAPASAADQTRVDVPNHPNTGHADWKKSTHHGWVCDDASDGYQVYAYWYFSNGGSSPRINAPAHTGGTTGNGCVDYYPGDTVSVTTVEVCLNIPNGFDPCGDKNT